MEIKPQNRITEDDMRCCGNCVELEYVQYDGCFCGIDREHVPPWGLCESWKIGEGTYNDTPQGT